MKVVLQDQFRYILRLETGEEVFSAIKIFAKQAKITSAYFSGIGACSQAELAYFDMASQRYHTEKFEANLEIVSFTGNLSLLNQEIVLHAHGVLSKPDFTCLGGHVVSMVISATGEIFLVNLNGRLERKLDLKTNLNLLS
jgi:predicted DNA-binding protein with PD1-like motif